MAVPTIVSGVIATNNYMLVTFSEGVYTTATHNTPIAAADFTVAFTSGSGAVTNMSISSITKSDGTALSGTGGESVVRMNLAYGSGIPDGTETVKITVASGTAVYNVTAEAMTAGQNTGYQATIALLYIYVSKAGNDVNDGFTPGTAKLTLGGAKLILQQSYNKIWIGIGDYVEVVSWTTNYKYVELWGDYDGAIFTSAAGQILHTSSSTMDNDWVNSYNRMTLKLTGSSTKFFQASNTDSSIAYRFKQYTNLVCNYCVLRAHTTNNCGLIGGSNANRFNSVSLNNTTLDTGNIVISSVLIPFPIYMDGFNNITSGKTISMGGNSYSCLIVKNSSLLWVDYLIYTVGQTTYIIDSILKKSVAGDLLINDNLLNDSITPDNHCIIKNTTIKDQAGNNLNINTNNWLGGSQTIIPSSVLSPDMSYSLSRRCTNHVVLENINADGLTHIVTNSSLIYDNSLTYDPGTGALDVLYYYANKNTLHTIPLHGLAISTTYNITFYYKKMVNSTAAANDLIIGVIESKKIIHALTNDTTKLETYAAYTANTHTYDTWYSKTLTFTTSANFYDDYSLIFRQMDTKYQFKITYPVVVAV